jgi:hydroxypyruvate isomerase
MPRFAANLSMLYGEEDFLRRFAAAAADGFAGVEYLFPYAYDKKVLAEILAATGLAQVLFNLPPGDWQKGERGIACHPDRTGEFRDGVGLALDYAAALGCKRLHPMAGIAPEGVSAGRLRETYLANLAYAAAQARQAGIALVIEPINTRDIPGFYLNRSRQALEIIDEVGADNLFLQYDIYHMQIMEGDLARTIEANLRRIGHMQLADNPGRNEPGTGEINYPFLFHCVDRLGYRGWIGCEYRPLASTRAGLGWLKAARAAASDATAGHRP